MNYVHVKTMKNLIAAGVMIAVGDSLQWFGLSSMMERVASSTQTLMLTAYDWSAIQALLVRNIYDGEIMFWGCLSLVSLCWAVGCTLLVAAFYRFWSIRLAALFTIGAVVSTVALSAPLRFADGLWQWIVGIPSMGSVSGRAEIAAPPGSLVHTLFDTSVFGIMRVVLSIVVVLALSVLLARSLKRTNFHMKAVN